MREREGVIDGLSRRGGAEEISLAASVKDGSRECPSPTHCGRSQSWNKCLNVINLFRSV